MPRKTREESARPLATTIPAPLDDEYRDYTRLVDAQLQTVAGVALWHLTQTMTEEDWLKAKRAYNRWLEDPGRQANIARIMMEGSKGSGGRGGRRSSA